MAAMTRPYFVIYNGVDRMVEAVNPAAAVRHVVGAAVTELRPARGAEVAAWVRANKTIEVAGQPGVAAPAARDEQGQISEEPEFLADDCIDWLVEHGARKPALDAFSAARQEQRMTLEQFDRIRVDSPDFATAILKAVSGEEGRILIDDVRDQMQDSPFPFDVVVGAIADAKRRENYVDGTDEPQA